MPGGNIAKVAKTSNRGSAPGERRGGRKSGTPNKVTVALKEMARKFSEEALATLREIMGDEDAPHAARVSAANAILDRGHGKPSQIIAGDEDGGPIRFEDALNALR